MNYRKMLWDYFYCEVIGTVLTSNTTICLKNLIHTSKKKFETDDIDSLKQYTSIMISKVNSL